MKLRSKPTNGACHGRFHLLFTGMLLTLALAFGMSNSLLADSPFRAVTQTGLSAAVVRPGYDLQPSILYDTEEANPARRFKMWWLGKHPSGSPADRIYYAESADGSTWSAPVPVLQPQLGASGANAADDDLLGSPTVLKRNGKFYMFYEAYGNWATVVNRLFSFSRGDNWTTHGTPQCQDDACISVNPDWDPSYDRPERVVHGFAPRLRKAGTRPVYAGEVRYASGPKYNRFLRLAPTPVRTDPNGDVWRQLNQGQPVFWLYDQPGEGRNPLYSFWDGGNRNTFTSTNANAEGVPGAVPDFVNGGSHILGYVAATLNGPDMIGSLQNRIMLATSTDGTHWTRFPGAARGGAVLAPQNELTSAQGFPPPPCAPVHERWDIHRAYGSGFPASTIRDGFLELHFTDDSLSFASQPCAGLSVWRLRIPVAEIENAQAYLTATRQPNALAGDDFKWSPLFHRYFAITFRPFANQAGSLTNQVPVLVWSARDPDPANPPTFPAGNELLITLSASRWAAAGGILCDGNGNTVDFFSPAVSESYSALHLFYEELPAGDVSVFSRDFGHTLIFGYPLADASDLAISSQPANQTVDEGGSVSFSVTASGAGPLSYQWQKNGVNISGATSALFTLSSVRPVDAGEFRVVVSNVTGSTNSRAALLSVRPMQALRLGDLRMTADGRSRFRVFGTSTEPVSVQRSSNMLTWLAIGSLPSLNGTAEFVEASPSGLTRNFYRAVIRTNASNTAPTLTVNPTLSVVWSGTPLSLALNGQVVDDGLPMSTGNTTSEWRQVTGPATVAFANPAAPTTTVTLPVPGSYRLRLIANDGALVTSADVLIDANAIVNASPVVNAGVDLSVALLSIASLQGIATDDGLPNPLAHLTLAWSKGTGPGAVTFANANAASTTATFSAPGTYRLWLTAFDGAKRASNDVVVTVRANQPPTVELGAARTVVLPKPTTPGVQPPGLINFLPLVTDDRLPNPPARVTGQWSLVSGPSAVGFGTPAGGDVAAITNSIYFAAAGDYVLRLEVSDGVLSTADTVSIHVDPPPNAAPSVNAGSSQTIDLPDVAMLDGTTADDGLPTPPAQLTNVWSKASGPGIVTFANPAQVQTTARFSLPGQYVLRLTTGDGESVSSDTTTLTVKPASDYVTLYKAGASQCGIAGQEYRIRNSNPRRSVRYVVIITYSTIFSGNYESTFTGTVGPDSTQAIECIDPPGDSGGRTTLGARISTASF